MCVYVCVCVCVCVCVWHFLLCVYLCVPVTLCVCRYVCVYLSLPCVNVAATDYGPEYPWWRIVLLCRKMFIVLVTVLASSNAMFQASTCLAVLCVAYALQAKYTPFVSPKVQEAAVLATSGWLKSPPGTDDGGAAGPGAGVLGVRASLVPLGGRRGSASASRDVGNHQAAEPDGATKAHHLMDYNVLETVLISSCVAIILGGMVFQSAELSPGSVGYLVLTALVEATMVGSLVTFIVVLVSETRATCNKPKKLQKQAPTTTRRAPPDAAAAATAPAAAATRAAAATGSHFSRGNPLLAVVSVVQRREGAPGPASKQGTMRITGPGGASSTTPVIRRQASMLRQLRRTGPGSSDDAPAKHGQAGIIMDAHDRSSSGARGAVLSGRPARPLEFRPCGAAAWRAGSTRFVPRQQLLAGTGRCHLCAP